MKRQHLVIAALTLFVLISCVLLVALGTFVWRALYRSAPQIDRGQHYGSETASPSAADLLPGLWECVEGNSLQPQGMRYRFCAPGEDMIGTVYVIEEPGTGREPVEADFAVDEQNHLWILPDDSDTGALSCCYSCEFKGADTMLMSSVMVGDENEPTTRFERVE